MKLNLKSLMLLLTALLPLMVWAQKPTWQDTDPNGANYLPYRHALVGRDCMINRIFSTVDVGSWNVNANNMLDEDLDNVATFPAIVQAELLASPGLVSVRDISRYYAAGTTAGFCVVASDLSVVSLNALNCLSIMFYKDGELVDTKAIEVAQEGGVLALNVIKIPGSEDVCMYLEATTTKGDFDEICLIQHGVVADVGKTFRVKYAFVGKDNKHIITTTNGHIGYNGVKYNVEANKWIVPVLIPFKTDANKLIDDDPTSYEFVVSVAAIGYRGTVEIKTQAYEKDGAPYSGETFEPGCEVGFTDVSGNALALSAGMWAKFRLYDRNGVEVQTEVIDASVLNVNLVTAADKTSSVIAKVPFSSYKIDYYTILNADLGPGPGIRNAFVRPKASVDHHCNIRTSAETDICSTQTSMQLYANDDLTIEWSVVDNNGNPNVQISPSGLVTGLDQVDGDYVFRATSLCGKGIPGAEGVDANGNCYVDIVIHKGNDNFEVENCDEIMTEDDFELMDRIPVGEGATGALLSITDFDHPEFILDDYRSTAAQYTSGLSIANDLMIVGVKTKDGSFLCDGTQTHDVRIGFDVEFVSSGLGADLLQFFNIRTYDVDVKTYQRIVNESNVLKLDLISGANTQRVKFAVTVPAGTKFDRFALWKSGLLNLDLTCINIYDIFIDWSPESSPCAKAFGCGVEQLNNEEHGARINADATGNINVITALSTSANLTYIVDEDPEFETYMEHFSTANAGGTTYAIDLGRTLDYRHQIGVVVDNKTYLAGVDVGGWLTMKTYYKGIETGDVKNDWKVLGADVIGYGDKNVLLMQPKHKYDEIRITVANVLEAVDQMKIYGLFIRNDIDNDGVPDCLDEESCGDMVTGVITTKACEGQTMDLTGTYSGNTGITLLLSMPEQFAGTRPVVTGDGGSVEINNITATQAGQFTGMFYTADGKFVSSFDYRVYPTYSRWRNNTINTDWNEWANWTNGAPYLCTNVTIPTAAAKYPSLNTTTMVEGDEYPCAAIHFEPGAAVEYVHRLNYTQAWVDLEFEANRNYLLSAALKSTYTGDFFVPENDFVNPENEEVDYFTAITPANTPASRFEPKVYQRLWNRIDKNRVYRNKSLFNQSTFEDQDNAIIEATQWSYAFNALNHNYVLGEGYALLTDGSEDPDNTGRYLMRLPKTHTQYYYFDDFSQEQVNSWEDITRNQGDRFIYEGTETMNFNKNGYVNRKVYATMPTVTTPNTQADMTTFLVGNPLMSHIKVQEFLNANSNVTGLKYFDGNTVSSAIDIQGVMVYSGNEFSQFNPMESFFVETATAARNVTVTFNESMFGAALPRTARMMAPSRAGSFGQLRLSVTRDNVTAGAVLINGADATAETLIDEDAAPKLAVFAVFDGRGYDIHGLGEQHTIPLGIYLPDAATVTLQFNALGNIDMSQYQLLDRLTGETHSLDETLEVELEGTSIGRFMLIDNSVPTSVKELTDASQVNLDMKGDLAIVTSTANDITKVEILATDGKVMNTAVAGNDGQVSLNAIKGVNVIVVYRNGKKPVAFKILN